MRIAIMQPYFLPYIGYWQLMNAVDRFIVYDNVEYTKKGWINRNRMLLDCREETFTIPIAGASDNLHVVHREVAKEFIAQKLLNKFESAYRKAPHYAATIELLSRILHNPERNLFRFIYSSIAEVAEYLQIETPLTIASAISADHSLKGQARVLDICRALTATEYVNPPGGIGLYDSKVFSEQGIKLKFLYPGDVRYRQFSEAFLPNLSIVDLLMFNGLEHVSHFLNTCFHVA